MSMWNRKKVVEENIEVSNVAPKWSESQAATAKKAAPTEGADKSQSKFIRLVYLIQFFRLLFVTVSAYVVFSVDDARNFILDNPQVGVMTCLLGFFLVFVVICIPDLMFTTPYNYLTMLSIVLEEALIAMVIVSYLPHIQIVITIGLCTGFVLVLFFLSLQPVVTPTLKVKIVVHVLILVIASVVTFVTFEGDPILVVSSIVGPFFFGVYVIYDTNLMITNQHQFEYSDNDYLPGSFDILLDVFRSILYFVVGIIEFFVSKL